MNKEVVRKLSCDGVPLPPPTGWERQREVRGEAIEAAVSCKPDSVVEAAVVVAVGVGGGADSDAGLKTDNCFGTEVP